MCADCGAKRVSLKGKLCGLCKQKKLLAGDPTSAGAIHDVNANITADELASRASRVLDTNLRRLEVLMTEHPRFRAEHATQANFLAKSVAALVKEQRGLRKDAFEAVKAMGHEGRVELMVKFAELMPEAPLTELCQRLIQLLNARKKVTA